MNRTETYGGGTMTDRTRKAKDADVILGNGLAVIGAGVAIALGVIGLLVGFDMIGTDVNTPFENGLLWLAAGVITGLAANVFRREHHVVDPDEYAHLDTSMSASTPRTRTEVR
jgi:hypothetical protein